MERFFKVKTTEEVLEIIRGFNPLDSETVSLEDASGRVLSRDVLSPEDLPPFYRASMDGYAVRAKDTFGATESLPAFLQVCGEVLMGERPRVSVGKGQAVKISTGGMLPEGADAVVMIEYCHTLDEDTIEVSKSVSPLENVISPGDDVRSGQPVLRRGRHLRPQDIGLLAGLGISRVEVTRRPKIAIISTGDEVVDIHTRPLPGQVRDVNRYSLSAFCQALGAVPFAMGRCKDEFEALKEKIGQGLEVADSVWISGGSSVGTRDLTLKVFQALGEFELLVHGISISPGKPTIIGRVRGKPVIGLPGHISSALVVAEVFLAPFLARLSGLEQDQEPFGGRVTAEMSRNVESASGRDDYLRVRLVRQGDRLKAEPIFGKSGLISPLVEGHGLVRIHRNKEGLYEGEQVEVRLFEWMPFFMDSAS